MGGWEKGGCQWATAAGLRVWGGVRDGLRRLEMKRRCVCTCVCVRVSMCVRVCARVLWPLRVGEAAVGGVRVRGRVCAERAAEEARVGTCDAACAGGRRLRRLG